MSKSEKKEAAPTLEESGTRLKGKVAIVTGAGSRSGGADGTGMATAVQFAKQGAKVLVVDVNADNAARTVAALEEAEGEASAFVADVTQSADCKAMVDAAIERFGHLNILFNNVGISGIGNPGTVLDVNEDGWERMMEINVKSMMLASKYAIPAMTEAGGGSIINVSSIAALRSPNMDARGCIRCFQGGSHLANSEHGGVSRQGWHSCQLHRPGLPVCIDG